MLKDLDFTFYVREHGIDGFEEFLREAGHSNPEKFIYDEYLRPELKYIPCMSFNFKLLMRKNSLSQCIELMKQVCPDPIPCWDIYHLHNDGEFAIKDNIVINESYVDDDENIIRDLTFMFRNKNKYMYPLAPMPSKCGLYFMFDEDIDNPFITNWKKSWQREFITTLHIYSSLSIFETICGIIDSPKKTDKYGEQHIDVETLNRNIKTYIDFMKTEYPNITMFDYM